MLSDEEKQELRELGASPTIREEFRLLRRNSLAWQRRVSVDDFLGFRTAMSRLNPTPIAPRPFVPYKHVKL